MKPTTLRTLIGLLAAITCLALPALAGDLAPDTDAACAADAATTPLPSDLPPEPLPMGLGDLSFSDQALTLNCGSCSSGGCANVRYFSQCTTTFGEPGNCLTIAPNSCPNDSGPICSCVEGP